MTLSLSKAAGDQTMTRMYVLATMPEDIELLKPEAADGATWIAASSQAMAALERAGLAYERLDSYSTVDEIAAFGMANYEKLDTVCTRFDPVAQNLCEPLGRRGIAPFRHAFFNVKIALDAVSLKFFLLENFLAKVPGSEILHAVDAPGGGGAVSRPLDNRADLMSIALERIAPGCDGVTLRPVARKPGQADAPRPSRKLTQRARGAVRRVLSRIRDRRALLAGGESFLLFNPGHDVPGLLPHLLKAGLAPVKPVSSGDAVGSQADREACLLAWRELREDDAFRGCFRTASHGYLDVLETYFLHDLFAEQLPRAIAAYDRTQEQLQRRGVRFALTGSVNLGIVERAKMAAAQNHGAPLITYQEGAGYGSIVTPIYDYSEMRDGDVLLCYGEGNAEYYRETGQDVKVMLPVGSVSQDEIAERFSGAKTLVRDIRRVMYVGTTVAHNIMHCPNNGLVDTYYFNTQKNIFDRLNALPDTFDVTVRLHPADQASRQYLSQAEFSRIRIEERPLADALNGVDLFVIDFPSTVLLNCCHTPAHIFLLMEPGVTGMTDTQKARIQKRARTFDTFDGLAGEIDSLAENPSRPETPRDDAYLRAYAVHAGDGRSAQRAVRAILDFVGAQRAA